MSTAETEGTCARGLEPMLALRRSKLPSPSLIQKLRSPRPCMRSPSAHDSPKRSVAGSESTFTAMGCPKAGGRRTGSPKWSMWPGIKVSLVHASRGAADWLPSATAPKDAPSSLMTRMSRCPSRLRSVATTLTTPARPPTIGPWENTCSSWSQSSTESSSRAALSTMMSVYWSESKSPVAMGVPFTGLRCTASVRSLSSCVV
mmetsp:Transcript_17892/g.48147  ORF Transcript_17892/g.48147 Transcript_17892/m.48147 type:complete len:202 (-) Transcript_17892:139-744(-)